MQRTRKPHYMHFHGQWHLTSGAWLWTGTCIYDLWKQMEYDTQWKARYAR